MSEFVLESRRGAVLLLAAAILGLSVLVIGPVIASYSEWSVQVQAQQNRVRVLQRLQADPAAITNSLQAAHKASGNARYYVSGGTIALASANMQRHLKSVVERVGGTLVSSQVLANDTDAEFPSVKIGAQLVVDYKSFLEMVYALETGRPTYSLEDVEVIVRPTTQRRTENGQIASTLDVRLQIKGFLKL